MVHGLVGGSTGMSSTSSSCGPSRCLFGFFLAAAAAAAARVSEAPDPDGDADPAPVVRPHLAAVDALQLERALACVPARL